MVYPGELIFGYVAYPVRFPAPESTRVYVLAHGKRRTTVLLPSVRHEDDYFVSESLALTASQFEVLQRGERVEV